MALAVAAAKRRQCEKQHEEWQGSLTFEILFSDQLARSDAQDFRVTDAASTEPCHEDKWQGRASAGFCIRLHSFDEVVNPVGYCSCSVVSFVVLERLCGHFIELTQTTLVFRPNDSLCGSGGAEELVTGHGRQIRS
jgi:hypothetical protein